MTYNHITRAGTDHLIWQEGFGFYRGELEIMNKRLQKIAARNFSFEVRQEIEHFQNQFIVQRNNIDELKHEVNIYVEKLSRESKAVPKSKEMGLTEERISLHGKYEDLERVMNVLRHEFTKFLSTYS